MKIAESLKGQKELDYRPPQFADIVGECSPKVNLAEPTFKGESFQDPNPDQCYVSEAGTYINQNMILHRHGTCPTCHQALPRDFGKYLNMPPDTNFKINPVEKLDLNAYALP